MVPIPAALAAMDPHPAMDPQVREVDLQSARGAAHIHLEITKGLIRPESAKEVGHIRPEAAKGLIRPEPAKEVGHIRPEAKDRIPQEAAKVAGLIRLEAAKRLGHMGAEVAITTVQRRYFK